MRNFITALSLLFCLTMYGQTEHGIYGYVIDSESEDPIIGASIRLLDENGKLLSYAISDNNGYFSAKSAPSIYELIAQGMGYRQECIKFKDIVFPCRILMKPQMTVLNDVYVEAPDIEQRSDTLSFYVNRYVKSEDKNIADVLRRLPGVKVEDNGQIRYNGEPINKFYIDGVDFLEGRYGLAVNNIRPEDVATVDIMENHQPINVLRGIEFSDQAGLNLKLREHARHKWVGIANGAIGETPFLYDSGLFAMRIAGKYQTMETFRANNTGWNPESQGREQTQTKIFATDIENDYWNDIFNPGNLSCEIDESRLRDSRTILANTSNSWKISNGSSVGTNITYQEDDLKQQSGYITEYFNDDIQPFIEYNKTNILKHSINGVITLKDNTSNQYINNNLGVDVLWLSSDAAISGTRDVAQFIRMPSLNVGNDLQMVKRVGRNLLSISSRNRYKHKSHSLIADFDNNGRDTQTFDIDNFRSVTESRYGWIRGHWRYFMTANLDFDYCHFRTDLNGVTEVLPNTNADIKRAMVDFLVSPEMSYQSSRWLVTLRSPISLYHSHNRTNESTHFLFSPSIFARWQITAKLDITAQGKFQTSPVSTLSSVNATILTDFRTIRSTNGVDKYQDLGFATLGLRYRNPISAVFGNIYLKQEWLRMPITTNEIFLGNYILLSDVGQYNDAKATNLSFGISKGLGHGRFLVGIDCAYRKMKSKAMRNDELMPYANMMTWCQLYAKGNPSKYFGFDYKVDYTNNRLSIENQENSSTNIIKQKLNINLTYQKWIFQTGAEHYYTLFNTKTSSNAIFFDASLRYDLSKKVSISLTATNLLNQKDYRFSRFGLLSESESAYQVRGRNLLCSVQVTF